MVNVLLNKRTPKEAKSLKVVEDSDRESSESEDFDTSPHASGTHRSERVKEPVISPNTKAILSH